MGECGRFPRTVRVIRGQALCSRATLPHLPVCQTSLPDVAMARVACEHQEPMILHSDPSRLHLDILQFY